jgi:hypothetical protein
MSTDAIRAFTITMWVAVLIALGAALNQIATAHADPAPPTPDEREACIQAWTPTTDPRVDMRYGLGTLMYQAWVSNQCSGPDAKFPNGALVAGSGLVPTRAPWQQLPVLR